ncbi:hypothetical protein JOB18_006921 [Solea senegalensis]|uniref:Uncharacterized protein n=1 Tax=Solea senegalensis TaxID=28829 RepID=A0AAV6RWS1_SOLSE|nr:hypothetical protein JOB18_006921 [Solea senegalensis]
MKDWKSKPQPADLGNQGQAEEIVVSLHTISLWGAEVKVEAKAPSVASKSGARGNIKAKKMKLTVQGGAAVDPDSVLADPWQHGKHSVKGLGRCS